MDEKVDEMQRLDKEELKYATHAIRKLQEEEERIWKDDGDCSDIVQKIIALMVDEYLIVKKREQDKSKRKQFESDCCM